MLYQNIDTGELLTKKEMLEQFREEYDGGDPTNPAKWQDRYEEVPDKLIEKFVFKAVELGWKVVFDKQENGKYAEFYKYSPAGEYFGFTVWYENIEELPNEVYEYYIGFDTEEHIETLIEAKKNGFTGVPSIKELVEDADAIDEMIEELSDALYEVYKEWDGE